MGPARSSIGFWKVAVIAGVGTAVLALAADWIGLGGRPQIGRGQILAVLVGIAVAIAAVAIGRGSGSRRTQSRLRSATSLYVVGATALTTAVVCVVVVELVGSALIVNPDFELGLGTEPRARLPYYREQEWSTDYWRELRRTEDARYEPFTLWRSRPFAGETTTIDARGVRVTPGASTASEAVRVSTYGGSAMWGSGAPDALTIAAHLQRSLPGVLGSAVAVENRAQRGYVSAQNLIELVRQIQRGDVPDVAIFYDGFNDVVAAAVTGDAGSHVDEDRVRTLLERPLLGWVRSRWLSRTLDDLLPGNGGGLYASAGVDAEELADRVARVYLTNCEIVSTLAERYDFEAFFFWQPVLATTEKRLTPEERGIAERMQPPLVALLRRVDARVRRAGGASPRLLYLGDALDSESEQVWIDEVHVTPRGNEIVADRIAGAVSELMSTGARERAAR